MPAELDSANLKRAWVLDTHFGTADEHADAVAGAPSGDVVDGHGESGASLARTHDEGRVGLF